MRAVMDSIDGMMSSRLGVWVVDYVLNSAWQLPVLLAVALVCAWMMRRMGAEAGHRVWVGAVLLSVVLPGCRLGMLPTAWWKHGAAAAGGHVQVTILPGVVGGGGLRLGPGVMAGLLAAYAGTVVYFAARLAWGLWQTRRIRREAPLVELCEQERARWESLRARMGGAETELRWSASIEGPMVVGVWRRALLVPRGFFIRVEGRDIDAALAHELAHLRRGDFARNLAYTALTVLVAYHPCTWLLRRRLAESREMVCDAMAAQVLEGSRKYAQSLLRLALAMPAGLHAGALPAVGIFDGNTLERRVVQMMDKRRQVKGAARLAAVAGAVLLGGAVCASAVGMRVDVAAGAPVAAEAGKAPSKIKVSPGVMAANIETKAEPKYPEKAKADHVQGRCTLGVTIDEEGVPTDLKVVKSVREDVDESALNAVQQWRWKPYLLNGNPIAVETTVNITYTLGN